MSQDPFPPQGSPPPEWRGVAPRPEGAGAAGPGLGKNLIGPLALLLILAGAVVAWLLFLRGLTEPFFLTIAIREYRSPLFPVNRLAVQDGDLLMARFVEAKAEKLYHIQTASDLAKVFRDLKSRKDRPVVIHLCALARASGEEVFILGGHSEPDQKEDGVALSELLQSLRDCPAPGKLLILDIMRPVADARLGLLTDDIAQRAHAILAKEKDAPFLVLCACSPGQMSLVSDELGQSIFAYYLAQGLRGHADGRGTQAKSDQRIHVKELTEFVQERVDRWAWHNRGVRQTPKLIGNGPNFPLVYFQEIAVQEPVQTMPEPALAKEFRKRWEARWKARQELRELGPSTLNYLDAVLLQTEAHWRGGKEEDVLQRDLDSRLQRVEEQLSRIAVQRQPPPIRALTRAGKRDGAFEETLRRLMGRALDPEVLDDKAKVLKKELDAEIQKTFEGLTKNAPEAAMAVIAVLTELPKMMPAHLSLAQQMLGELKLTNPYVETVYVERLLALAKQATTDGEVWPETAARQALRALMEAERVATTLEKAPALLPWVDKQVDEADRRRRAGEKMVFAENADEWPKAKEPLQDAENGYKRVHVRLEALIEARQTWDRASELLPRWGAWAIARGKGDERTWAMAVSEAQQLAEILAEPGRDPENVPRLRQLLQQLEETFQGEIRRCQDMGGTGEGDDHQDLQALLQSSLLTVAQRDKIRSVSRELELRLHEEIARKDEAPMGSAAALGQDRREEREDQRRLWRIRHAVALMRLAGVGDADTLNALFHKVASHGDDAAWQDFVDALGRKWPTPYLKEFKTDVPAWGRVERLSRFLGPFDLDTVRSTKQGHWTQNPTLALYRRDLESYCQWLSDRYRQEGRALASGSRFASFYAATAEDLRQFADNLRP